MSLPPIICSECKGHGYYKHQIEYGRGETCGKCKGAGSYGGEEKQSAFELRSLLAILLFYILAINVPFITYRWGGVFYDYLVTHGEKYLNIYVAQVAAGFIAIFVTICAEIVILISAFMYGRSIAYPVKLVIFTCIASYVLGTYVDDLFYIFRVDDKGNMTFQK